MKIKRFLYNETCYVCVNVSDKIMKTMSTNAYEMMECLIISALIVQASSGCFRAAGKTIGGFIDVLSCMDIILT